MARELVLIPKPEYDHLLKLSEEQSSQMGGQQEGPQTGVQQEDKQTLSSSNEKENDDLKEADTLASNVQDKTAIDTTDSKKPRLYVDKPISEMPFTTSTLSKSVRKGKSKWKSDFTRKTKATVQDTRKRWVVSTDMNDGKHLSKDKDDETGSNARNCTKPLRCEFCSKDFKNRKSWKRHMESHLCRRKCAICEKSFSQLGSLRIHQKNIHGIQSKTDGFKCTSCNKHFHRKYQFDRHVSKTHQNSQRNQTRFSCRHCESEFPNYEQLFQHVTENHPLLQQGGASVSVRGENGIAHLQKDESTTSEENSHNERIDHDTRVNNDREHATESALNNTVGNRYIIPSGSERYDLLTFLGNIRDEVRTFLTSHTRELKGIKWNLCVQVEMERDDNSGNVTVTTPYFRSRTYTALTTDDVNEHDLNEAMQKIFASLEKYIRDGSGWFVKKVLQMEIHTIVYRPIRGSAFITLPETLSKSESVLNIYNQDEKCFLYCLLASLHPSEIEPEKVEHYRDYEHEINMSGITFPVTLPQICKIEKQNENISINIFTYEDDIIVPLRITELHHRMHHVNLLWLSHEGRSHYCLITNFNRFMYRTNKYHGELHFCHYCLHGFVKEAALQEHQQYCSIHGAQRVQLPTQGQNDILEFKEYEKTLRVPFVIYADFETINRKLNCCMPNPELSSTTLKSKLEVCGFGYKVVSQDPQYTKPSVIYRGEDAGRKLIECLLQEQKSIQKILSVIKPLQMTDEQNEDFKNTTRCCICKKSFSLYDKSYGRIARHHCHFSGSYIGAACNSCNLGCKQANFIPVIFHNLKNFDAHILCENIGLFKEHRLKCIAQNTEKYVSFSLGKLRFIDSLQFLPSSLETLVDDLNQQGLHDFPHLASEIDDVIKAKLLLRKGVYMYEYMDTFEKFDETQLPSKEHFYSTIKKNHISQEDYDHALTVFKAFNLASLGDYHNLYLKTDVLLLADVFESFRNLCLTQYELDPCHFYTSPGLSWTACLKLTGVKLELLTDIDKVLMVEAGIRGGVSQISNRYQKANNPYLQDYDPSQPTVFLSYLDANNLYGWAMMQPLPVGEFAFLEDNELDSFDVTSIPTDGDTGYILEVSLEYCQSLHDYHNCFPLAPVRKTVKNEELSPYAKQLLRKLHGITEDKPLSNRGKVEKLLTTLDDKDHYVLLHRNLCLYLRLGMKLKTIHRVLRFRQMPWLKTYIDLNTKLRMNSSTTFQKYLFKLMNCSVFGKTMENVRRHKNIELVHTQERLKKVAAKPTYKNATIFNEDLVAVELFKTKVNMFKPIYCGMCVLDLSKCLMYEFWYDYIKQRYSTAKLHMTDTDSLLFSCETEDLYEDMKQSLHLFDTSDYAKEHFLFSASNTKVPGLMKDELNGKAMAEFVGLRSKMYSFTCNGKEQKRAKGIAAATIKNELKHTHYKETLFGEKSIVSSISSLRSYKHELFSETIQKTSLSAFCDKRYLIDPVNSYAFGHFRIKRNSEGDAEIRECDSVQISNIPAVRDSTKWKQQRERTFIMGDCKITPCVKL